MAPTASVRDESLLQSALGGSQQAWAELVARYHAKGLHFIRRQVDDPHLAQDIMQTHWAALVQAVRRQSPDQFSALFWTLLRRRIVDELRRKGRTHELPTLDAPSGRSDSAGESALANQAGAAPDPQEWAVQSEEISLLHQALARLPDHYRVVITARQLESRSNREAADLLLAEGLVPNDGNVEKRVENYYYRGLKELKKQLLRLGYPESTPQGGCAR